MKALRKRSHLRTADHLLIEMRALSTVVIAFASFWMLQDYPHSPSTTFLTPQEKTYLQERLKLDSDGLSLEFKKKFIWHAFLDYKVWIFAFMYQVRLLFLVQHDASRSG